MIWRRYDEQSMPSLEELRSLIYDVREHIDHIYAPLFVVQGITR